MAILGSNHLERPCWHHLTTLCSFMILRTPCRGHAPYICMRLSYNMATGKGLAAILRPKTINFIGNNKLSKFSRGVLRECTACQRHIVTVATAVGGWNCGKSKHLTLVHSNLAELHHSRFPTELRSRRFRRRVNDLLVYRVDVPILNRPTFHPLYVLRRPIRAACRPFSNALT